MHATFTYRGATRQIVKHPAVVARLKRGEITEEQAAGFPWYLRLRHRGQSVARSLGTADRAEAIRRARVRLDVQDKEPDKFTQLLEASATRSAQTWTHLVSAWVTAGCPHPGGSRRTDTQAQRLIVTLRTALNWWGPRGVAGTRPRDILEFVAAKRAQAGPGHTGERAADLELAALSACCQWALVAEHIERNPLADRPRFRRAEAVSHCHEHMPRSDEDLHRVCGWLMAQPAPDRVVCGAHLMLCALTGLRPGEPGALLRQPTAASVRPLPGTRYQVTAVSGGTVAKLAVAREKNGQNLAVIVHPALAEFLAAWERWLAAHLPGARYLLPDPDHLEAPLIPFAGARASRLRNDLDAACRALGIDYSLHSHGMRAFYVRVRRAQGADDLTISVELGQGSGGALIRSTYGDGRDVVGDGRFDWMPGPESDVTVAWTRLDTAQAPQNIVPIAAGPIAAQA